MKNKNMESNNAKKKRNEKKKRKANESKEFNIFIRFPELYVNVSTLLSFALCIYLPGGQ